MGVDSPKRHQCNNEENGDGNVVASGDKEVGPLAFDAAQVVVLQLYDTLGILLENVLGLLDDFQLLLLGQVVSRLQLVVSLIEKTERVLIFHVKQEEVGTFFDDFTVAQTILAGKQACGSRNGRSHDTPASKKRQVHHMQVCQQEIRFLARHLANVVDKLDLRRHDGRHELLFSAVIVEQQVLLALLASGHLRLPHISEKRGPLGIFVFELLVQTLFDRGKHVVKTLQALSEDLVVTQGKRKLECDQLVDLIMKTSGFHVDSVGQGSDICAQRNNFLLVQLGCCGGHFDVGISGGKSL